MSLLLEDVAVSIPFAERYPFMEISEYYSSFAELYVSRRASTYSLAPAQVDEFLDSIPPCSYVLDAGCGPGIEARVIVAKGHRVLGADLSSAMIDRFKENLPDGEVIHADLRKLPLLDHTFDSIFAAFSLLHMDDADFARAVGELSRVCRPGGQIFFAMPVSEKGVLMHYVHREAADTGLPPIPFYFRDKKYIQDLLNETRLSVRKWEELLVPNAKYPVTLAFIHLVKSGHYEK